MDIEARNKLVDENRALVCFMLKRYFPNRAGDDDWHQEGYLGLIQAANTFKPELGFKFSTYATKCIWTSVMRLVRPGMQRRFEERAMQLSHDKGFFEPMSGDAPDEDVQRSEAAAADVAFGQRLLARLTERERAIFQMRVGEEQTLQVTADKFGITKERVRQIVLRIHEKLSNPEVLARARLEAEGQEIPTTCSKCGGDSPAFRVCEKCQAKAAAVPKRKGGRPRKPFPKNRPRKKRPADEVAISRRRAV